jgi:hypothetical protein
MIANSVPFLADADYTPSTDGVGPEAPEKMRKKARITYILKLIERASISSPF